MTDDAAPGDRGATPDSAGDVTAENPMSPLAPTTSPGRSGAAEPPLCGTWSSLEIVELIGRGGCSPTAVRTCLRNSPGW